MYRALYRKWRPRRFEDVVGQRAIVTALKNQVASGRVGHAYLFTGVRGTGKTTCAKIFAKAVNCLDPQDGGPCCACAACRGIEDGSILDVVEMDAASNNGVDDIRDLRDETAYTPSACKYKVYIIDEVHMLSTAAFNALLKTLEEPPAHVIFILATTEIQKVPATIRSRCQRYDFTRIEPEDIAARVSEVAAAEGLSLTEGGAALIARLADGALRDALSILDTCAGVTTEIDEAVVRRMAGVTDRSYLFRISDAVTGRDCTAALAELAALRRQSVDVRRLTEELIAHYRSLLLAALPGGQELLSGVSPEEEALYLEKGPALGQREAVRAIRALGTALERMARGNDQRIELELALFALTEPPARQAPDPQNISSSPAPVVQPAAQPFVRVEPLPAARPAPVAQPASPIDSGAVPPWEEAAPAPDSAAALRSDAAAQPVPPMDGEALPPWEDAPPAAPVQNSPPARSEQDDTAAPAPPAAYSVDPQLDKPRRVAAPGVNPYPAWEQVVARIRETDPMLYGYLKKSKAYYDGNRVLIDGGKTFRDFIRANKASQRLIKKLIAEISGVASPIGPYEPKVAAAAPQHSTAEQSLHQLEARGLEVTIEDSERKRR